MNINDALFRGYARCFAKPSFLRMNRALYNFSMRGLGILNYQTPELTGESWFLNKYLSALTKPLVLDVGANVGDYAVMVKNANASSLIVCFEPHPKNVERLRSRKIEGASIVSSGVGENKTTSQLHDYLHRDGSSHASVYQSVIEEIHKSPSVSHHIDIISLDDYCRDNGVTSIQLLKIDVEGAELSVIRGARNLIENHQIDALQFEFNEMNVISRTFMRDFRLSLTDYSLYRLLPRGMIPLRGNHDDELFAYQNIVALSPKAHSIFAK